MIVLFLLMKGIHRHYVRVAAELVDRRGRGHPAAGPDARDRAGVEDPQADDAGRQLRAGHATLDARGRHRHGRPGRDTRLAAGVGQAQHPRAAEGARLAVPRGDRPGHRLRAQRPARTARATWSRCSSPSTSSGTGGSTCCTTRAPCGSRAGCCSRPGVMVTSVPWQLAVARQRGRSGSREPGSAAARGVGFDRFGGES